MKKQSSIFDKSKGGLLKSNPSTVKKRVDSTSYLNNSQTITDFTRNLQTHRPTTGTKQPTITEAIAATHRAFDKQNHIKKNLVMKVLESHRAIRTTAPSTKASKSTITKKKSSVAQRMYSTSD